MSVPLSGQRRAPKISLQVESLEDRSLLSVLSFSAPQKEPIVGNLFINDNGNVAGTGTGTQYSKFPVAVDAFIWSEKNGNVAQAIRANGEKAEVTGINNKDKVVGIIEDKNNQPTGQGFLFDKKTGQTLTIAAPSGDTLRNLFINDAGQIAGTGEHYTSGYKFSYLTSSEALLWSAPSQAQPIRGNARVLGITNSGLILGEDLALQKNAAPKITAGFVLNNGNSLSIAAPSGG